MSFAENLKQIRKERNLSQEDLAELLDVSRQAVSKWEQGEGYPEAEKLLLLSKQLNISLDTLMSTDYLPNPTTIMARTGSIVITSPHENVIATCCNVQVSQKMSKGKHTPQYALFTTDTKVPFGGNNILLGWYADEDRLHKEIAEIQNAISKGVPNYTLQYSCKVKFRWGFPHIIE